MNEFNNGSDSPEFQFGTKAETLASLVKLLTLSKIPEFFFFDVEEWQNAPERVLEKVRKEYGRGPIIVRSSALSEDNESMSMAGAFTSIAKVNPQDQIATTEAIEEVCRSYSIGEFRQNPNNQIIIQDMVTDVSMSGVLFTQELNSGAPYFTINYDDYSGDTSRVAAGGLSRTLLVHRGSEKSISSRRFSALIEAVNEIEKLVRCDTVDIEFAVNGEESVFIFQVRKITTTKNWNRGVSVRVGDQLNRVEEFLRNRLRPISGLMGSKSIFGKMPDWNPAEIIGSTPRPLSFSLYRYLVTDRAWRIARARMGYFHPIGWNLMTSFSGQPFIDARLSFNSLLPAGLSENIGGKLIDSWIERLADNPHFHDKVEFKIATTAYCFDTKEKLSQRYSDVLSKTERGEFQVALHGLTKRLLNGAVAPLETQIAAVDRLATRRANFQGTDSTPGLGTAAALLEDCVEFGTIPFAILARHAFIANEILESMVSTGAIDRYSKEQFLEGIQTVAGDFVDDLKLLSDKQLTTEQFNERYGHLRPGTYDILSVRYDQRRHVEPSRGLQGKKKLAAESIFPASALRRLSKLLAEEGFDINPEYLIRYITEAIKGREYAKFIFTRNLSDALEIIGVWGEKIGLSREELSFLEIGKILDTQVLTGGRTLEKYLRDEAERGRHDHEITEAIRLPQVIHKPSDLRVIPLRVDQPNFITRKIVQATCMSIDGSIEDLAEIDRHIVLIESADPGFDWIFSRSLAGLITKFGGINSHMAIRCAEFGLPAAIGCGEQIFTRIQSYQALVLNCAEERIVELKL